ncbi:MAG: monooxygenase FAD-binding protein [Glaciihabitans sp.]|nr:monooxygenase FAD-binding protein [Glaciihabitans sp.]
MSKFPLLATILTSTRRVAPLRTIDFRDAPGSTPDAVDILVIGSGPAGMTVAAELVKSGHNVLVVESGGLAPDSGDTNTIVNVGAPRVDPQSIVRTRALGGTSAVWSGRIIPLDDIDFEVRDWVPSSGWPIGPADLAPYLRQAADYFQLGPQEYGAGVWEQLGQNPPALPLNPRLLDEPFWQYSRGLRDPSAPTRFATDIAQDVTVLLHATVTRLEATNGTVTHAILADRRGTLRRLAVGRVVIAAGAIETPRLLLASGLGSDSTGRYFMDHAGSVIGSIPLKTAAATRDRFGLYWKKSSPYRLAYMQGVALAAQLQREEKLLNAAAWLDEYPAQDDPWQAGLRIVARLRNRTSKASVESVQFWRSRVQSAGDNSPVAPSTFFGDVLSVIRHPLLLLKGIGRLLRNRPPQYLLDRVDLYALVEQLPDPDSRITLAAETDDRGMPLARVDWKLHRLEYNTMVRLGQLVASEFERVGLPPATPVPWMRDFESWRGHVLDRAHQIGTTRMSVDSSNGVVDTDCRVFGLDNLYVAGSAVFPTSGHANPTFTIVALAIRLADHLGATATDAPLLTEHTRSLQTRE